MTCELADASYTCARTISHRSQLYGARRRGLTSVLCNTLHALASELCQVAVESQLVVEDLISLDLNVCSLALGSSQGLMDHDPGVGQRIPLTLPQLQEMCCLTLQF